MENLKYNILVVEDERPLLEAIKTKLNISGFNTLSSRSVAEALSYLTTENNISVIWLDHYLLGQDNGLDLVAQLKDEDSPWKEIPIFVVSNTASSDKVQSYIQLGINQYYTKSDYRLDDIIADIKNFLNNKAK
ncbi:response regulator [Patescibacteria group bacterium]|nr:response regulator [Patescibacteria group bacterium]